MSRKYLEYILDHISENKLFVDERIAKQFYITSNPKEISSSELRKLQSVKEFVIEPGIKNVYTNEKHNVLIRRNSGRPYIMWCLSDGEIPSEVIGCYKYAFQINHRETLFIPHSMYYCTIMSIMAADAEEIIFEDGLERITLNNFDFDGHFDPEYVNLIKAKRIHFPNTLKDIQWLDHILPYEKVFKAFEFEEGGRFEKVEGMFVDNKTKKVLTVYDKVPEIITYQGKIIGENAFSGYDKSKNGKLIFPESFEEIGKKAFDGAEINELVFKGKLKKIAPNAFVQSHKSAKCFKVTALNTDPLDFVKNDIDFGLLETYFDKYKNNLIDLNSDVKYTYDNYIKLSFERIVEYYKDVEFILNYVIEYDLIDKDRLLNVFGENVNIQSNKELKTRVINRINDTSSVEMVSNTENLFEEYDDYSYIKDNFDVVESNKGLVLSNYKGGGVEVLLPKMVNGKKISLAPNTFDKLKKIQKLTIGCSVNNSCFCGIVIEDLYFEEGLKKAPKISDLQAVNIHFPKSIKELEYLKIGSPATKTIEIEEGSKYFVNSEDKKSILTKDKKQVALCIDVTAIPSSCNEVLPTAYYFNFDEYLKLPENIKVVNQYPLPICSCILHVDQLLTINDSLEDFKVSESSYFSHTKFKLGKSFKGNLDFLKIAFDFSSSIEISPDNPYYKVVVKDKLRMVFDKKTDELIFINYENNEDKKRINEKDSHYKLVVPSYIKKIKFLKDLMPYWAIVIIPKTIEHIQFEAIPPYQKIRFEDCREEVEKKTDINPDVDYNVFYYNQLMNNIQIFNYKIEK